jgi:hypothetical protein
VLITLEARRAGMSGSTEADLEARRHLAEAIESMRFVIQRLRMAARLEPAST